MLAALRRLRMDLAAVAEGDQAPLVWTVAAGEGTADGPLTGVRGQEVAQRARGVVQDSLTYLEPRAAQLRYAAFRAVGDPIGSGSGERAHKLLVEARLKGAGMQWARPHVNPLVGATHRRLWRRLGRGVAADHDPAAARDPRGQRRPTGRARTGGSSSRSSPARNAERVNERDAPARRQDPVTSRVGRVGGTARIVRTSQRPIIPGAVDH